MVEWATLHQHVLPRDLNTWKLYEVVLVLLYGFMFCHAWISPDENLEETSRYRLVFHCSWFHCMQRCNNPTILVLQIGTQHHFSNICHVWQSSLFAAILPVARFPYGIGHALGVAYIGGKGHCKVVSSAIESGNDVRECELHRRFGSWHRLHSFANIEHHWPQTSIHRTTLATLDALAKCSLVWVEQTSLGVVLVRLESCMLLQLCPNSKLVFATLDLQAACFSYIWCFLVASSCDKSLSRSRHGLLYIFSNRLTWTNVLCVCCRIRPIFGVVVLGRKTNGHSYSLDNGKAEQNKTNTPNGIVDICIGYQVANEQVHEQKMDMPLNSVCSLFTPLEHLPIICMLYLLHDLVGCRVYFWLASLMDGEKMFWRGVFSNGCGFLLCAWDGRDANLSLIVWIRLF